jgi:hypothetical protein
MLQVKIARDKECFITFAINVETDFYMDACHYGGMDDYTSV